MTRLTVRHGLSFQGRKLFLQYIDDEDIKFVFEIGPPSVSKIAGSTRVDSDKRGKRLNAPANAPQRR